jgi:hypothetical protein
MSYPIVLCVLAVEALNLVALWAGLRLSISRVARPLVAGAGLSGAWGAWILTLVLRGPPSMLGLTGAVLALSSVGMGIAIYLATMEEPKGGEEDGGAPIATAEGPSPDGSGEPVWWPEFQSQLADYAARQDRERQLAER